MMPKLVVGKGLRTRYNRQSGVTRVDLDPTTIRQLRDAYEATGAGSCTFFACPGPDAYRATPCATCPKCDAHITLRRTLKRLGILTER